MGSGDWAPDREEAHFPEIGWTGFDVSESDDAMQMDGVQAAVRLGYVPAPEDLLFCFLPAVWPDHARAWIRDTRVRYALVACDERPVRRVPWSTWTYFEMENDVNSVLVECGFEHRPPGRLWLLKPPPMFESLESTLRHLGKTAEDAGIRLYGHQQFADHVAHQIERLFATSR